MIRIFVYSTVRDQVLWGIRVRCRRAAEGKGGDAPTKASPPFRERFLLKGGCTWHSFCSGKRGCSVRATPAVHC